MDKTAEIVVFGSCMIDLICYSSRLPKPGETIHGLDFELGNGGKGANQCVAASKLGAHTALIARVGNDSFGLNYKNQLGTLGINTEHVHLTDAVSTGMAQITVSNEGENTIVIVAGANSKLSIDDAKKAEYLFMNSKVIIFQFETPIDLTIQTLELIRKEGGPFIIVNGAPAASNLNKKIFQLCDIFCVNESEASEITGLPVTCVNEAKAALSKLQLFGCRTPIITLGKDGAIFSEDKSESKHIIAPLVTPIDTTGAGDSFIGALAYLTVSCPNTSLATRISRSCRIASMSVLSRGTQASFPSRKNLPQELFLEEDECH